jgi:GntR family transcriptional regulator
MVIEDIRLPAELVPGITAADFTTGLLYRMLADRFAVVVSDAVQTAEPTVTDAEEAGLLQVPVYAPALLFERVTRTGEGRIVEYTRSLYRGDRYRITSRLTLDREAG